MASSKKVIYAALAGNGLIAVSKFVGASITGSSAMVAEGIHSVVDTGNQVLLLHGLRRAKKPADAKHPFGYGAEIYFWAFVVAILIFSIGAGISIWHGVEKIIHPHEIQNARINYVILGAAIIFEGVAWTIAYIEFKKYKGKKQLMKAVRDSKDPTIFTVLFEDSAAMAGLIVATIGIWIATTFNIPQADGIASVTIGVILAVTASLLAYETKGLLIGEAADPQVLKEVKKIIKTENNINAINEIRTLHRGPNDILLAMSVDYKSNVTAGVVEKTNTKIEQEVKQKFPDVKRMFIEVQSNKQHKQQLKKQ